MGHDWRGLARIRVSNLLHCQNRGESCCVHVACWRFVHRTTLPGTSTMLHVFWKSGTNTFEAVGQNIRSAGCKHSGTTLSRPWTTTITGHIEPCADMVSARPAVIHTDAENTPKTGIERRPNSFRDCFKLDSTSRARKNGGHVKMCRFACHWQMPANNG